jgi:hypothetical protein
MNNIKLNWLGEGFTFGKKTKFFCINAHGLDLVFSIYKSSGVDGAFGIHRESKNTKTINKERIIDEEVKSMLLIKTDDEFRNKFKHSYYILKLETDNYVANLGAYCDTRNPMSVDNIYLLCTTDFVNLLAEGKKVELAEDLRDSNFESLMCLIDENEMTKELLRD